MTLALTGGKPAVEGGLDPFNTIGKRETEAVTSAMLWPLSGYLGGLPYGGMLVQRLEERWATKFGVQHAIACNSATSGLLAAASCLVQGAFNVSPYTMSATAAAPALLGYQPHFVDVESDTFCIDIEQVDPNYPVIATNLFGHPARLHELRKICDENGTHLIEDNAQAPLATENHRYAGTIGHIGVFSLNVHKHIQCGEGGIVVTNDGDLADRIRGFINHGEMAGLGLGLNLRMTEVTAAIALSQLANADTIVASRVYQARKIIDAMQETPWLETPAVRKGCSPVHYVIPFLYNEKILGVPRRLMVAALRAEGFPLIEGYVKPLYHLPAFASSQAECPVAEQLYAEDLVYFENCAWSPTDEQISRFGEACRKLETHVEKLRSLT